MGLQVGRGTCCLIWCSVSSISSVGFCSIVVNSDSLSNIRALNRSIAFSPLQALCVEDTITAATSFNDISFAYVPRRANQLVHALAKDAITSSDEDIWLEEMPSFVSYTANLDVSCFRWFY